MSDLRGFYAYHPDPLARIAPRRASVQVFSNVQDVKYSTFNFLLHEDDNGILVELDEIDACPDRDVTYCTHDTEGILADNRDVRGTRVHQRTPHNTMLGIAIDYMKRNIPLPSDKEAIIAEGTYEEYRSQAEVEQQPKHIKDIINDAPDDSILGLMRCIKEDSDAITRTTDGPTDKKYDWPDDPDHECYHMEEVI